MILIFFITGRLGKTDLLTRALTRDHCVRTTDMNEEKIFMCWNGKDTNPNSMELILERNIILTEERQVYERGDRLS